MLLSAEFRMEGRAEMDEELNAADPRQVDGISIIGVPPYCSLMREKCSYCTKRIRELTGH
jgi:hypothetical protein